MLHIYNGILLSHKRNKGESVELRWMNLDIAKDNIKESKGVMTDHGYWDPRQGGE